MSRKSKGINAERELIHLFWKHQWAAIRIAGSGSSYYPSCDIVASNILRKIAVECKTSKDSNKYLEEEEVNQLLTFAKAFGAEPWLAIKFDRDNWYFVSPNDLEKSGKNFVINQENAKKNGILFEELIK